MIIPYRQLSQDALLSLVEEFVTRDGTDYGEYEVPVARRIEKVLRQLEKGNVFILFDAESSSCNLVSKADLSQLGLGTDINIDGLIR